MQFVRQKLETWMMQLVRQVQLKLDWWMHFVRQKTWNSNDAVRRTEKTLNLSDWVIQSVQQNLENHFYAVRETKTWKLIYETQSIIVFEKYTLCYILVFINLVPACDFVYICSWYHDLVWQFLNVKWIKPPWNKNTTVSANNRKFTHHFECTYPSEWFHFLQKLC